IRARFRANTCASQSAWKAGSSASCSTGGKPCMPPTSLIRLMGPPHDRPPCPQTYPAAAAASRHLGDEHLARPQALGHAITRGRWPPAVRKPATFLGYRELVSD